MTEQNNMKFVLDVDVDVDVDDDIEEEQEGSKLTPHTFQIRR